MSNQDSAGFIGLGAMGSAVARRLLRAGIELHVYDPDDARMAAMCKEGAVPHGSPREVADAAPVVYACLPSAQVSREAALGPAGVCGGAALRVYAEMSTIGRAPVRDIAAGLAGSGVQVVDAPVSGGPRGANAGSLSIMLAGAPPALARVRPHAQAMGKSVFEVGAEPGQAQMMKLVNNLISAANMVAAYEALVLGAKAGLDPDLMVEIINVSTGRNSATLDKVPRAILTGTFDYGATIRTIHKDVSLGLAEAEALRVPMWLGQSVRQAWEFAMTQGGEDQDFTALIRYMEDWAGARVRGRAADHGETQCD
ncbi:NAD(P)-dependent oxidoreductase [Bordetella petrii]|uniref:NAD(P)-dependent oxidoreductase n=1 Tax=Bordetella petrii TaxID=94624 RepID=UPI00372F03CA